jgi:soluble lytic murein transglycosylase-like protein
VKAVLLCSLLLNLPTSGSYARSMAVCVEVSRAAEDAELPQEILISLAWYESRFNPEATSRRGARGPLQIMPAWVKPGRTLAQGGADALKWWRARANGWREAIAFYNAGRKPGSHAFKFSDRVLALAESLGREVAP